MKFVELPPLAQENWLKTDMTEMPCPKVFDIMGTSGARTVQLQVT